jgi:hypothetical protein
MRTNGSTTPAQPWTPASPAVRLVRCACDDCGAHSFARMARTVAGECPNCGSYERRPVESPNVEMEARAH